MSPLPGAAVAAERRARRLLLGLLAVLAAGAVVWLWRVYGFTPLRVVESR
jgi:hypothetical protein